MSKACGAVSIQPLLHHLAWDSDVLGIQVAALEWRGSGSDPRSAIKCWKNDVPVGLIQFLCDAVDQGSLRVANSLGFSHVDTRLTLDANIAETPHYPLAKGYIIRRAGLDDVGRLCALGGDMFVLSRYFWDTRIPRDGAIRLHHHWLTNAVNGTFDDECHVLVDTGSNDIRGFCTIKYMEDCARIGLFGLSSEIGRLGLGKALLSHMFGIMRLADRNVARVSTQARNVPAQRLYQRMGFTTSGAHEWFHLWLEDFACDSV